MERKVFLFSTIEKKTDSSPLCKERLKMNLDSEFNCSTAHSTDAAASPTKEQNKQKKSLYCGSAPMSHASSEGQRWYFDRDLCLCPKQLPSFVLFFSWPEFLKVLQNRNKQSSSSSCCHLGHVCKHYLPILGKRELHQIVFVFPLHKSWPRLWEIKWNAPGAMTALKWNLLTFGCRCNSDDCGPHKPLSPFTCVRRQMQMVYYFSSVIKKVKSRC